MRDVIDMIKDQETKRNGTKWPGIDRWCVILGCRFGMMDIRVAVPFSNNRISLYMFISCRNFASDLNGFLLAAVADDHGGKLPASMATGVEAFGVFAET
jgi:hypothetical protein